MFKVDDCGNQVERNKCLESYKDKQLLWKFSDVAAALQTRLYEFDNYHNSQIIKRFNDELYDVMLTFEAIYENLLKNDIKNKTLFDVCLRIDNTSSL